MKTFIGTRVEHGTTEVILRITGEDDKKLRLSESPVHVNDFFEWGYNGPGPKMLALALIANVEDKDEAAKFANEFTEEFVAKLPFHGWEITGEQIKEALAKIRCKHLGQDAA